MRKLAGLTLCVLVAGCTQPAAPPSDAEAAFEKSLQQQFLDAKPGSVIEIPPGRHALQRVLTLRANGVTVRGAGSDKSILSFKNQISGPEGMLVYANDFTIEHLAIEDGRMIVSDRPGLGITLSAQARDWTVSSCEIGPQGTS